MKSFSAFLFSCMIAISLPAQTFTPLVKFNGTNGDYPIGYLIQGTDGNIYGTTDGGGTNGNYGTIFRLTPQGRLTTAYSFCSLANCVDGEYPEAGLTLASDGNFYGSTAYGGDTTCRPPDGCGTLFRITPRGKLTTIHVFELTDGAFPWANLTEGADGNLYGTTSGGGKIPCGSFSLGCGTVFKITPQGSLTTLHTFDYNDGAYSISGLVQASNGYFYGTTGNPGTIFRIAGNGAFNTLYDFGGGSYPGPNAPMIEATDGNLYGTNFQGWIFAVLPTHEVTTLYDFGGGELAAIPEGLTQATDGNLYGPTFYGGDGNCTGGCGILYQLTLDGAFTNLHNFTEEQGYGAQGSLLQGTTGIFYGTASYGGAGYGTAYSLSIGLGPFVAFVRNTGGVGQTVGILGQGLTGTTQVSFNGTSSTFSVVSDTFLKANVPAGASNGYVTVDTPSGALKSNVSFRVITMH
jgi:uncharacterized repeat protein (TIGR03803 family)